MLSGAGSRTWVEHSLAVESDARIESGASDATVDAATDLTSGVALAGGFRLELAVAPPTRRCRRRRDRRRPRRSPTPPKASRDRRSRRRQPRRSKPTSPSVAPLPVPSVSADDPAAALAAIQAAATGADGRPVYDDGAGGRRRPAAAGGDPRATRSTSEVEDEDEFHDAEITLPPPAPGELLGDVMRWEAGAGRRRARERSSTPSSAPTVTPILRSSPRARCAASSSPPARRRSSTCRGRASGTSSSTTARSSSSITSCSSDATPTATPIRNGPGLRRVKVIGDKVSRSHLEIRYQGWDVLVADCGSTNGTFVVPHPGGQVTGARGRAGAAARARGDGVLRFALVHRRRQGGRMKNDLRLRVEYCGEVRAIETSDELTFGRAGDLRIDDNRHLHRVLGRLWARGDQWWLTQRGQLDLDPDRRRRLALQRRARTGHEIALSFPNSIVRFRAGITDYELTLSVPDREDEEEDDETARTLWDDEFADTIALGDILLTDEQRLLLLALAEPTLRDPHVKQDLPANRAVARRLGWSITKFNRKLDNLCNRFTKLGVGGLRGSIDQLATDRRRRLVDHAIESGLISADQLDRLPPEPD